MLNLKPFYNLNLIVTITLKSVIWDKWMTENLHWHNLKPTHKTFWSFEAKVNFIYTLHLWWTVSKLVDCTSFWSAGGLRIIQPCEERECEHRMASGQHVWDWQLCAAGPDRPREGIWSRRSGKVGHTGICGAQNEVLGFTEWVGTDTAMGGCHVPLVQLQLAVCRYGISAVVLAAVSKSRLLLCAEFGFWDNCVAGFHKDIFWYIFLLPWIKRFLWAPACTCAAHTCGEYTILDNV